MLQRGSTGLSRQMPAVDEPNLGRSVPSVVAVSPSQEPNPKCLARGVLLWPNQSLQLTSTFWVGHARPQPRTLASPNRSLNPPPHLCGAQGHLPSAQAPRPPSLVRPDESESQKPSTTSVSLRGGCGFSRCFEERTTESGLLASSSIQQVHCDLFVQLLGDARLSLKIKTYKHVTAIYQSCESPKHLART